MLSPRRVALANVWRSNPPKMFESMFDLYGYGVTTCVARKASDFGNMFRHAIPDLYGSNNNLYFTTPDKHGVQSLEPRVTEHRDDFIIVEDLTIDTLPYVDCFLGREDTHVVFTTSDLDVSLAMAKRFGTNKVHYDKSMTGMLSPEYVKFKLSTCLAVSLDCETQKFADFMLSSNSEACLDEFCKEANQICNDDNTQEELVWLANLKSRQAQQENTAITKALQGLA